MINIKTFALFEANNYNYTREDIKKLPIFSILKAIGFEDSTTDRIWSHGNMRLYNKELDMNGPEECITIYGNGPIRKTVAGYINRWLGRDVPAKGNPHILKRFPPINTLEDWNVRLFYILEWARKRYKSRKGMIIDLGSVGKGDLGKFLVDLHKTDIDAFHKIYSRLPDDEKELFLREIGQKKEEFEKNLEKYFEIRKRAFF
jgi:hypothetical protein